MKHFQLLEQWDNPDTTKLKLKKVAVAEDMNGREVKVGDAVVFGRNFFSEVVEIYDGEDVRKYGQNYNVAGGMYYDCREFVYNYPRADFAFKVKGVTNVFYSEDQIYKLEEDEYATYEQIVNLNSYKDIMKMGFVDDITTPVLKKRGNVVFKWKLQQTKGYGRMGYKSDYGRIFVRRNDIRRRDLDTISGHQIRSKATLPLLTLEDYDKAFAVVKRNILRSMKFQDEAEALLFTHKRDDWNQLKKFDVI